MKKVKAIIERANDGTYGVFVKEEIQYGIIGDGGSVKEAIDDFYNSYEEMKQYYKDENKEFKEYVFVFEYDLASFLNYYSKFLGFAALERITGVNQKQLHHYATGHRNPRPDMVKKIENSIHLFAKELEQVKFV